MDSGKLQPALFGGLFIGVITALPLVNLANCCCCLWVVCGGVLAAYLRQQNTPYQVPASEGALIGLMAGIIGGVLGAILSIPLQGITGPLQQQIVERMMASNPDMPPEMRDIFQRTTAGSALRLMGALFNVVVFSVFGMLGGLLGVAVFKKNAPPPPPPGTVDVLPPQV